MSGAATGRGLRPLAGRRMTAFAAVPCPGPTPYRPFAPSPGPAPPARTVVARVFATLANGVRDVGASIRSLFTPELRYITMGARRKRRAASQIFFMARGGLCFCRGDAALGRAP